MRVITLVAVCTIIAACDLDRLGDPGRSGAVPLPSQYALSASAAEEGVLTLSGDVAEPPALPVPSFTESASAIDVGCALLRFTEVVPGRVLCWGDASTLALGDGPPQEPVYGMVGDFFSFCAIREADDRLTCWGRPIAGTPAWRDEPVQQVAVGWDHLCALLPDSMISCTGPLYPISGNEHLFAPEGTFLHVTAANYSTCAIRTDLSAICWSDPVLADIGAVPSPAGQFTQLSISGGWGCGIRPDDTLACWGTATNGETDAPAGTFTQVRAGGRHACAVRTDGPILCWGDDSDGRTSAPEGAFRSVSAGNSYSCGIRSDDEVVCWGRNHEGQLGAPSLADFAPRFTQVASGANIACAVLNIPGLVDRPYCWGGTDGPAFTTPTPDIAVRSLDAFGSSFCGVRATDSKYICWGSIPALLPVTWLDEPFQQVAVGEQLLCALRSDDSIGCTGMLFPDPVDNRQIFPPGGTHVQLDAEYFYACAVGSDEAVRCWGSEFVLGGSIPAPAAGQFTRVAVGTAFGCGITTVGTLTCWGADQNGQSTPPAGTYSDVSASNRHACAVRSTGTLACWGSNSAGQTSAPAGGSFTRVAAGFDHTCALRTDGGLTCWGNGSGSPPPPPPGNTPAGTDVTLTFDDGASITFGEVTEPGETTISFTDDGPDAPIGYHLGDPGTWFDVESSATFTDATLCVDYDPAEFTDDADVIMLHGTDDDEWEDVTTTGDADDAQVCGVVASFSPFMLVETNAAPVVTSISLPSGPVAVGSIVQIQASFVDPNISDTHVAMINWGDGTVTAGTIAGSTITGTHVYLAAGTYLVTVEVSDGDTTGSRTSDSDVPEWIVVFDPAAGFVTGGGWFESPAAACPGFCSGAVGRASFGFVARYQRGRSTPDGNAQFQFRAGGLEFRSTAYEWLVIAGARAQFRGTGDISGSGEFAFSITAIDGSRAGGGDADRIRVRIWNATTGEVIYDNHVDTAEDSNAATILGGGAIMIHDR